MMKNKLLTLLFLVSSLFLKAQEEYDSVMLSRIFSDALTNTTGYQQLEYLCNNIGPRLGGSPQAAAAVEYMRQQMELIAPDSVYLQEIMVRNWKRGITEKASITSTISGITNLNICALGGSVGTNGKTLVANIIEVKNLDELKKLNKKKVAGKAVFISTLADPTWYNPYEAYRVVSQVRALGAIEAAKLDLVAVFMRSANPYTDDYPHTGIMRYDDNIKKIPAVALSTKDADLLSSIIKNDPKAKISLTLSCYEMAECKSHNVIGELRGSEFPNEVIVIGGHLDSWDLATGAHDDGAGCIQALEVLRIFKAIDYRPKRTIRVVMFMDEEMMQRGGRKYAENASKMSETHIAAIESDRGAFTPHGFSIDGNNKVIEKVNSWAPYFKKYGLYKFDKGYGGVDISFLKDIGTPLFGLMVDWHRYFLYHHAATDTFDKIFIRELQLGGASITGLVYFIDKYGL